MKLIEYFRGVGILLLLMVMMVIWTFAGRMVSAPNSLAVIIGFGLYIVLLGLLCFIVNFGIKWGRRIYKGLTDEKT